MSDKINARLVPAPWSEQGKSPKYWEKENAQINAKKQKNYVDDLKNLNSWGIKKELTKPSNLKRILSFIF